MHMYGQKKIYCGLFNDLCVLNIETSEAAAQQTHFQLESQNEI